jgi:hypothetical protein
MLACLSVIILLRDAFGLRHRDDAVTRLARAKYIATNSRCVQLLGAFCSHRDHYTIERYKK